MSRQVSNQTLVWHAGQVSPTDRHQLFGQTPLTVWMTGLSGAGKSTLAYALEARLMASRHACAVLDGDNIRHGLCHDLGFSEADRRENIRRVAEVARLMNESGLIVISAFISPFRSDRQMAAEIIGPDRFREIYLSAPLSVCEQRDPKGFYQRARRGEISQFTGISSPYEEPESPAVTLNTDTVELDECVDSVLQSISQFMDKPHTTNPSSRNPLNPH